MILPPLKHKTQSKSSTADNLYDLPELKEKMRTMFHQIKNKSKKDLHSDIFRNEQGAIDLASIMVGIIVIGLIGGVIASTVFAVIPWTQDNAAKQQLDSVVSAESAYIGLSSTTPPSLPAGAKGNSFGNSAELATAKLMGTGPNYCVVTPADGKSYVAYSKSASGAVFHVTDKNSKAEPFTGPFPDPLPADCQFLEGVVVTPDPTPTTPPVAYVDPTPTTTKMTFRCDVETTGKLPVSSSYSLLAGTETWSDGYTQNYSGRNVSVTYNRTLLAGVTYTVTYEGTYTNFSMFVSMQSCLRSLDHWGSGTGVTNAIRAFYNSKNLTSIPEHIPPTITNMDEMFFSSNLDQPSVSNWDTSKVTSMEGMFRDSNFNQPLDTWNTSNVTNMKLMFYGAKAFNKPLDSWNVAKVTNMSSMFRDSKFDQPLNSWNVAQVSDMSYMFSNASVFNQDISMWNVDKVTSYTAFATSSPIATKTAYLPKF